MRLLEHEGKQLVREAGIPIPHGEVVSSPAEAADFARRLGQPVILKAQVLAGGRMKAGGIDFAQGPEECAQAAAQLLGKEVRGLPVGKLLVEERLDVEGEVFLAVTYDHRAKRALVLASTAGGIDVEQAATEVRRRYFSLLRPFPPHMATELGSELGFGGQALRTLGSLIPELVKLFLRCDALLVEINPLALIGDRFFALDVHIELDDEALFRQKSLVDRLGLERRPERFQTEFERQAAEIDAADHRGVAGRVVEFEGDLGLLIGGGGASLTIFDAVLDADLRPADYCEIGGNPSVWKVKELTKLILSRPEVERIAVIMNIVSNTRVDLVARGVIKGILELGYEPREKIAAFRVPGSWEEEGFAILRRYGVPFYDRGTSIDEVVRRIAGGELDGHLG